MLHAAYLMPLFPLAGFVVLLCRGPAPRRPGRGLGRHGRRRGLLRRRRVVVFAGLLSINPGGARHVTQTYFTWIPVGGLQVKAALLVDPLSMTMACSSPA